MALAVLGGARAQTLAIPALANGWSSKGCITYVRPSPLEGRLLTPI